ncbi:MAG: flagellar basal body L-ring protein FlgH [Proteobacteria bacterium]|nr:flagellar basal body L-ring protein FlgH [Pseudomonadota bacterium]
MSVYKLLGVAACALLLAGCSTSRQTFLSDPELSPVGSGMTTASTSSVMDETFTPEDRSRDNWIGGPADYFRDQRGLRRGDLITVKIELDDRASFNSSSARTRKGDAKASTGFDVGLFSIIGQGAGEASANTSSSASGQGTVSRSEKLSVSLAAVVRQVYPNGMLYIEGSQETMVDLERRDVKVSGLVRPTDVEPDNSVEFSKIAEARIQYGGEGKVSDVKRPGWGLQLWDKVNPF